MIYKPGDLPGCCTETLETADGLHGIQGRMYLFHSFRPRVNGCTYKLADTLPLYDVSRRLVLRMDPLPDDESGQTQVRGLFSVIKSSRRRKKLYAKHRI